MNRVVLFDDKKKLIKVAYDAENSGLCKPKTGNISLINREEGYVIITPSSISKLNLTPEDIIVTDLVGNVYENIKDHKPSIELPMHISCYEKREDINAVVHTHSTYATAFAVAGKNIPPVATEAIFYGEKTILIPYEKPGTISLALTVKQKMDNCDALLLEKHGVIALGKDLDESLLKAKYIEEVAKIAIFSTLI